MEEYAAMQVPLTPSAANMVGETEIFEAEIAEGNILKVRTEEGSVRIHLRSYD